ncbi:MAG: TetR/AcrR family transcriptional regulator [Desulfuromusa sp.]
MSAIPKNKRDAILNAALNQLAENGFHSSPVSRLATLAGVSVGTIYRYFKDKDAVIHAVYEKVDEALSKELVKNLASTGSEKLQYIQLVTNLIDYLNSHPKEFKFLEQYYSSPYGIEKKHAKFLREGKADQENPFMEFFSGSQPGVIKKLPLPLYLAITFGPITFLLRDALSGLVTLDDTLIQQTAEASWNAIKA